MSSKVVVKCSNGHKFPVNLNKHKNRPHVFCPECKEKVVVRKKRIFSQNPDWEKQKERHREDRLLAKTMRKRAPKEAFPMAMPSVLPASEFMARAMLIQRQIEKKRRKEGEQRKEN